MKPPEIIETRRLRLRPPVAADATAIFEEYAQDTAVTRYLIWRPHKQIDETYEYLKRCAAGWDDASAFTWVLTRKEDGHLLDLAVSESSGHSVLDQDALEVLKIASPLTLKHPLGKPQVVVQVPISYRLER